MKNLLHIWQPFADACPVITQNPTKKRKNYAKRRLKPIDLDKIQHKFLNVLDREAKRLLDESFTSRLPDESAKTLVNYLKLLTSFRAQELEELDHLTDEELAEKANQGD